MAEEPKSFWTKLAIITTFLTALASLLGLIYQAGLFYPDHDDKPTVVEPISTKQFKPTVGEATPPNQFGTIYIYTPPPSANLCMGTFQIDMASRKIVPTLQRYPVSGIRLGTTRWTISGSIQCFDGSYCESYSSRQSGIITLRDGDTYLFHWGIVPGSLKGSECHFMLSESN